MQEDVLRSHRTSREHLLGSTNFSGSLNGQDGQWFSKCGPQTTSTATIWQLGGNANSQAPPQPAESDSLGLGSSELGLQGPR